MDKISRVKNEVLLKEWAEMIQSCKSSGLPVTQWCASNNLNYKTYYYRLRKVRERLCEVKETHQIVPVALPEVKAKSRIIIEASGVRAEVCGDVSHELLRTLIGSLKC